MPSMATLLFLLLPTAAEIVDLSLPLGEAPLFNANRAACTLFDAVNAQTRGYVLLKGGAKVAEHYRDGVHNTSTHTMWSVTKSWSSLLVGRLVDAGALTLSATLDQILPNSLDWSSIEDGAAKGATKLADVLTMTSGFVDPTGPAALTNQQDSLVNVLNHATYSSTQVGSFNYLSSTHLLSHVIHSASAETSPDAYAQTAVFPALGINAGSYSWPTDAGALEGSAYGLKMTVEQMAKLGQLYLQGGRSSAAQQLISSSYVSSSTTYKEYWGEWPGTCESSSGGMASSEKLIGYGFQWWMQRSKPATTGGTDIDYYCAIGHLGQFVCVYPSLDAVFATASDQYTGACALLGFVPSLLSAGADAESEECAIHSVDNPTSRSTGGSTEMIAVGAGAAGAVVLLLAAVAGGLAYSKRRSAGLKRSTPTAGGAQMSMQASIAA